MHSAMQAKVAAVVALHTLLVSAETVNPVDSLLASSKGLLGQGHQEVLKFNRITESLASGLNADSILEQSESLLDATAGDAIRSFAPAEFAGVWYEAASSLLPRLSFEAGCICTQAVYSLVMDEEDVRVAEAQSSTTEPPATTTPPPSAGVFGALPTLPPLNESLKSLGSGLPLFGEAADDAKEAVVMRGIHRCQRGRTSEFGIYVKLMANQKPYLEGGALMLPEASIKVVPDPQPDVKPGFGFAPFGAGRYANYWIIALGDLREPMNDTGAAKATGAEPAAEPTAEPMADEKTPKQTPTEAPAEETAEKPTEAPAEETAETPTEAPAEETAEETSAEAPAEETAEETSAEAPAEVEGFAAVEPLSDDVDQGYAIVVAPPPMPLPLIASMGIWVMVRDPSVAAHPALWQRVDEEAKRLGLPLKLFKGPFLTRTIQDPNICERSWVQGASELTNAPQEGSAASAQTAAAAK